MQELILHQGPRIGRVPNASPFCMKVELFLRYHKIAYETGKFNPQKAPRGKMPYVKIGEERIGDSEKIIERLMQEYSLDPDAHLTAEQKAISHLIKRTLEEATYFIIFSNRWLVDENWRIVKKKYFGDMPPVVRTVLPGILRNQVRRTCNGQGVSRYPEDELSEMLNKDLAAVDQFMSDGEFFFGDQYSLIDNNVFAWLSSMVGVKMPRSVASRFYDHKKFVNYVEGMTSKYFQDLSDDDAMPMQGH